MNLKQYNFCTLFDSNYLAKGLALYYSLEKNCDNFHLYIFAFNEKSRIYLENKKLEHATVISLKQFEDIELLKVKPKRTIAEYCWTSTSSTILYCLNNYDIDSCTYLDSDLYFYTSPDILFQEIGNASIAFTRHNYHFLYNQNKTNGEYCVQFMFFRNDELGLAALKWWRGKCLEWCYNYLEDGKFGDQGYLYELIEKFDNVHIINNEGAGMAPWNLLKYKELINTKYFYVNKAINKEFRLVFFHFHYLHYKISTNSIIANPGKVIFTPKILLKLYVPYLKEIYKREQEFNFGFINDSEIKVHFERNSFIKIIMVIIGVLIKRNGIIRSLFIEKKKSK